ncbi:sensor domain-containing diguanylate cyclase [Bacillus sp. JJ1521]|uniref:sensor domain-containing diguanylate cyclase n=1 Tax=Bacillus sp. JJ1521 TaxID=3122957 RepID=UPI003000BDC5
MELYGKRIIVISILILFLSITDFLDDKVITFLHFKDKGYYEVIIDLMSPLIEIALLFWALYTGKKILRQLHEQEEQYQRLVQFSPEAIIVHRKGKILYINDSGVKLLGSNRSSELLNRDLKDFVHPDSEDSINKYREQLNKNPNSHLKYHIKIKRIDGTTLDLETLSTVVDFKGHPARELIARDITVQHQEFETIKQMAYQDALTGLPNRRAFMDKLDDLMSTAEKNKGTFGMMFIDLDGFKQVNDLLGHEGGDMLLRQAGDYLIKSVAQKDTVARLAGDEFMVLLPDANENECVMVANRIIEQFQSIVILGKNVVVTPSIGIALYPQHGKDAIELIKFADMAMYQAKQRGKNNYQIFKGD